MYPNFSPTVMENWYESNLGSAVAKSEITGSGYLSSKIFGYFLLQLGGPNCSSYLPDNLIHYHLYLGPEKLKYKLTNFVQAKYEELPFADNNIDAILLAHVLEFTSNPQQILAEVYETLVPEGKLIIFGFNPYSLWGLTNMVSNNKIFPCPIHLIKPKLMRQWLIKLGFQIDDYKTFFFRPPVQNQKVLKKLLLMEALGPIFWPYLGASYMFIAEKRVTTLTSIPFLNLNKRWCQVLTRDLTMDKNRGLETPHWENNNNLSRPISRLGTKNYE